MKKSTLRLTSKNDLARAIAKVFRGALLQPVALIAKPRTRYAAVVQLVAVDSDQFRKAESLWADHIVGTYQLQADRDALLDAIMEDLERLRDTIPMPLKARMPRPISTSDNSSMQLPAGRGSGRFGLLE